MLLTLTLVAGLPAISLAQDESKLVRGRELFAREWIPDDPRSHAGDGLGPVFNDTSCVGCHNQGGSGGGGPEAKNVRIISAFSVVPANPGRSMNAGEIVAALVLSLPGLSRPKSAEPLTADEQARIDAQRERLFAIHPGFRTARSVVLHRFSTDEQYGYLRHKLSSGLGFRDLDALRGGVRVDEFRILHSERNTTSLFGSGKINSIPDRVLLAAAETKYDDYPEVSGRVSKLKNGWIGRFGWKAQTARLDDFVLTACAVELGLDVPGVPQSGLPHKPDYVPPGLDLSQEECHALTAFVASLPQPIERGPATDAEREYLEGGRKLFAAVGCAICHTPQLGEVVGIYSDLLLHDMGETPADSGSYAGFAPNSTEEEELEGPVPPLASTVLIRDESRLIGATRQEWRTPPLWGVRDSAPYLHDGRAATLEEAIRLHGGEALRSRQKFFELPATEQLQLTLFLKSLAAPAHD
jgi:CxxC motif-containing protein (DUF1111 family)